MTPARARSSASRFRMSQGPGPKARAQPGHSCILARTPDWGQHMSRILIAEDEPRIVRFLAKGLQAEGHTTASAADGERRCTSR